MTIIQNQVFEVTLSFNFSEASIYITIITIINVGVEVCVSLIPSTMIKAILFRQCDLGFIPSTVCSSSNIGHT